MSNYVPNFIPDIHYVEVVFVAVTDCTEEPIEGKHFSSDLQPLASFHISGAVCLRISLFWDVTQCQLVVRYHYL